MSRRISPDPIYYSSDLAAVGTILNALSNDAMLGQDSNPTTTCHEAVADYKKNYKNIFMISLNLTLFKGLNT